MKRVNTITLVCFFLFFLTVVIPVVKAQKIGLLMDSYVIDRWYKDQEFFVKKVEALGGTCQVESAFGDPHEQVKLARKMIDDGVKALVVIPSDAYKAGEIAKMAKEAGIPVISYDRLIMSNNLSLYISFDNEKVGQLQAEYVVKKVPKGNYLLLNGPTSDNNAILFRNGQMKVLQNHIDKGEIKILADFVMSDWNEIESLMKVDEYLSTHDELPDVIIAANDALANGAIEALKNQALEGKVAVTGQDADISGLNNIIAGTQSMTIYKPIKALADLAAESAVKLSRGEKLEHLTTIKNGAIQVNSLLLEPIVVDKDNYRQTVIKDGQIKEEALQY